MAYAAITTAALFLAIILNDLVQNESGKIAQHALVGFICVLIIIVLSQKGYDLVAWGLLLIPLTSFLVSLVGVYLNASPAAPTAASEAISSILNPPSKDSSVIGLPASSSVAAASCAPPVEYKNCGGPEPAPAPNPVPPKRCGNPEPVPAPKDEPSPTGPPGSIASNLSPLTACAPPS
jgi:hypothetical protein